MSVPGYLFPVNLASCNHGTRWVTQTFSHTQKRILVAERGWQTEHQASRTQAAVSPGQTATCTGLDLQELHSL